MTVFKRSNNSLLTTSDVARLLHIPINTVRRWSNLKVWNAYRIGPRGDRRFRKEDIVDFLNGRAEKVDRA